MITAIQNDSFKTSGVKIASSAAGLVTKTAPTKIKSKMLNIRIIHLTIFPR